MKETPFNPDKIKATSMVFPDISEPNSNIVFHGSSCAYAPRIESLGFEQDYRPWQNDFLLEAATIIRDISVKDADTIESAVHIPVKLSFAKSSISALKYAITKPGGQTLSFLLPYLKELRKHSCKIVPLLDKVNTSNNCVYAVDLSTIPALNMTAEISISHHVSAPVPISALVDKVIIPRETKLEDVIVQIKPQYDLSSIYEEIRKTQQ